MMFAQNDPQATAPAGFYEILTSGGWPGLVILIVLVGLSIAAVYLVIDQAISLRRQDVVPTGLSAEVAAALRLAKLDDVEKALRSRPSVLAGVIAVALKHREFGWAEVEKSVEDTLIDRSAAMHRRIDYLAMIANLSPMVGLLGTVTGMIFAFRQVAASRGAAGAGDLAEGIYQALVTTVGGLIVAIPALAASSILRARVDELLAEVTHHAAAALMPLRKRPAADGKSGGRIAAIAPAQLHPTQIKPPPASTEPAPAVPTDPRRTK